MENMNEISTDDFSSFFSGEIAFADEAPAVEQTSEQIEDLMSHEIWNEESGENEQVDLEGISNGFFDDSADELSEDFNEFSSPSELPETIAFDGERYDRTQVEKAIAMHSKIDNFAKEVNSHFEELESWENNMNQLQYVATSEINEYIDHYQGVLDNPRADAVSRTEAYQEIKRYQSQKAAIEMQYQQTAKQLAERKANAERLKGKAVYNQLTNSGWKDGDFSTVANYMSNNNLIIPFGVVDSSLMIALKKAAMFDAGQAANKEEIESSVQRAIAGKPARNNKPIITPENSRIRAKAEKMAATGELSTQDMFNFLRD